MLSNKISGKVKRGGYSLVIGWALVSVAGCTQVPTPLGYKTVLLPTHLQLWGFRMQKEVGTFKPQPLQV